MRVRQLAQSCQGLLDAGRAVAMQGGEQARRLSAEDISQGSLGDGFARRRHNADDVGAAAFGRFRQSLAEEAADGDDDRFARLQRVQQGRFQGGLFGAGDQEGICVLRAPEVAQPRDRFLQHRQEAGVIRALQDADEALARARRGVAEVRAEEGAFRRVQAPVGEGWGRGAAAHWSGAHCSSGIRNWPASMICISSSQMLLLRQGNPYALWRHSGLGRWPYWRRRRSACCRNRLPDPAQRLPSNKRPCGSNRRGARSPSRYGRCGRPSRHGRRANQSSSRRASRPPSILTIKPSRSVIFTGAVT